MWVAVVATCVALVLGCVAACPGFFSANVEYGHAMPPTASPLLNFSRWMVTLARS